MRYFYLGAMAEVDPEALAAIRERMGAEFGAPVRDLALPGPEFAYDAGRSQYRSTAVLEMLLTRCPDDAFKILAVTERDLFIPVLTFVYGHAQLGGRAAVISLARLRQEFYGMAPNHGILVERAIKEALHEAGHTLGLAHCGEVDCAMSLSTNVRQIDRKRAAFCARCAARFGPRPRE